MDPPRDARWRSELARLPRQRAGCPRSRCCADPACSATGTRSAAGICSTAGRAQGSGLTWPACLGVPAIYLTVAWCWPGASLPLRNPNSRRARGWIPGRSARARDGRAGSARA